jgi:hypothetical protein
MRREVIGYDNKTIKEKYELPIMVAVVVVLEL